MLRLRSALVMLALSAPAAMEQARAFTASDRCEAAQLKAAGQYAACRLAARATGVLKDAAPDVARCDRKLDAKWGAAEERSPGACLAVAPSAALRNAIAGYDETVAAALGGAPLVDLPAELARCRDERDACVATPPGQLLATGQTACFDAGGAAIACAASGQDGESQRGLQPSFTDNGDGTVTDARTGLTWERLGRDGLIHDQDAGFSWTTAFATKIALLNAAAFAGYDDWRLPNVAELQTLVDYGTTAPAARAPFTAACVPGCGATECSCTAAAPYWTATSSAGDPAAAWSIDFATGLVTARPKREPLAVRAVRGGP